MVGRHGIQWGMEEVIPGAYKSSATYRTRPIFSFTQVIIVFEKDGKFAEQAILSPYEDTTHQPTALEAE